MAARLGAEVLPSDANLLPAVRDQTNGEGAPVVIEATGNARAMEQTVELVASGGRVVIVALVSPGTPVALPGLDLTRKEMTILGSRASTGYLPEALRLLASSAMHYPAVATEFDMWEAPGIIRRLAESPGELHKAVLLRS